MAQFFLYQNQDKRSKNPYPFFIDVQNSLLSDLNSRIVIPLTGYGSIKKIDVERLCPIIPIHGNNYVLLTHQLTSVPVAILTKEELSLEEYRFEILDAIDMLVTGI